MARAFAKQPQIVRLACVVCGQRLELVSEGGDTAELRLTARREAWDCRLLAHEWVYFCSRCK